MMMMHDDDNGHDLFGGVLEQLRDIRIAGAFGAGAIDAQDTHAGDEPLLARVLVAHSGDKDASARR